MVHNIVQIHHAFFDGSRSPARSHRAPSMWPLLMPLASPASAERRRQRRRLRVQTPTTSIHTSIRKDMTVPDSAWLLSRYVRWSWETKRTAQKETPEKCLKSRRAAIACGTLTFACAAELLNRGVRGPLRNRSSFKVQASRVTCARDRESVNCRSQGQSAIRRRRGAATTHPPR